MKPIPDITLRDLCRWDRRLSMLPPAGVDRDTALDAAVSWAVSVRATPPLLPPLRGDELVVLPLRVMAEIETSETMSRDDLLATLAQHKIAAILTEPDFTEEPLGALPVLTLPAPFPHDAEGTLNRLITERRAELYHLGNELSRRLSQAAMDPRGVEALLGIAADVARRPLVLQDADGNVVAWGGSEMIAPASFEAMAEARRGYGPRLFADGNGTERLITALSPGGQAGYLSTTGPTGTLTESDRLVLAQTAGTCSIVLGQGRAGAPDRGGRQRLVADLLLGRIASDAAALARAQSLGVDPAGPVVVGLIACDGDVEPVRQIVSHALGRAAADNLAPVPGGIGLLLPGIDPERAADALRRVIDREHRDGIAVALSRPVPDVVRTPEGLREARFALALSRAGAVPGPVICCRSVDDLGVFSLLYPLWGNPAVDEFRAAVLGALEAYDQRRSSNLAETLETYLSLGGALAEAAHHLGIHRNTLSYRLRRISELTGRDLNNPRDRFLLRVALLTRYLPPPD